MCQLLDFNAINTIVTDIECNIRINIQHAKKKPMQMNLKYIHFNDFKHNG